MTIFISKTLTTVITRCTRHATTDHISSMTCIYQQTLQHYNVTSKS